MINRSKQVHKKTPNHIDVKKNLHISSFPSAGVLSFYFCRWLKLKPKAGSRPEATSYCTKMLPGFDVTLMG